MKYYGALFIHYIDVETKATFDIATNKLRTDNKSRTCNDEYRWADVIDARVQLCEYTNVFL